MKSFETANIYEKRDYSDALLEQIKKVSSLEDLRKVFKVVEDVAIEEGVVEPMYLHPERGAQALFILDEEALGYINAIEARLEGGDDSEMAETVLESYQNYGFPPEFIYKARELSSN